MLRQALALVLMSALTAQESRPANEILREFERVAMPGMSEGSDPESVRRFHEAIVQGSRRKAALALELFESFPDHERVPELLGARWALLTNAVHENDAVIVETSLLLDEADLRPELRVAATHARTHAMLLSERATTAERLRAVRELVQVDRDSELTGIAIVDLVEDHLADPAMMRPLLAAAQDQWPDSGYVGRPAKRWLALLDLVGKPFRDQLPPETRAAFDLATGDPGRFTVVQVWLGWVATAAGEPEIATLRTLRDDGKGDIALVGLYPEFRGSRGEPVPVVIDWPQIGLPGKGAMQSPFGANRLPIYFVLDDQLRVVTVVGRSATVASFLHRRS
ncbi:MAG: hypothetical protein U1E73_00760 [Planctomycetota bacterium]